MRLISVRTVVAALIIVVHVLLVIFFVPVVRIERPAFGVTEVSLAKDAEPAVEVAEPVRQIDKAPVADVR